MKNVRDPTRNSFRRCYRRTALLFDSEREKLDRKYLQADHRREKPPAIGIMIAMFLRLASNRFIERSRFRSIERAKEGALTR